MLGVCKSSNLFEYVPEKEHVFDCPFSIKDLYTSREFYVTPGCLVWKKSLDGGHFYDPCRSGLCASDTKAQISLSQLTDPVPFDIRDTGSEDALGTWPIKFLSEDDRTNEQNAVRVEMLTAWRLGGRNNSIPWRMSSSFVDNVVSNGGSKVGGGVGNTKAGKNWGTSEGFANTSLQFCDAISDWWPEDWTKPVGYHVTLPCDGKDSAYRTFDSAFVMETDFPEGEFHVTMRYMHTMVRNITSASNEYGRSGFCRRGAYGMPTHVTNTMRVCTRDAVNVQYDASVPVAPKWVGGTESMGEEHCAETPYDVPWSIDAAGYESTHPGVHCMLRPRPPGCIGAQLT
jgi:hypothetical protein